MVEYFEFGVEKDFCLELEMNEGLLLFLVLVVVSYWKYI